MKYKLTSQTLLHDLDKKEFFGEKGDSFEIKGVKIYFKSDKRFCLLSDKISDIVKLVTIKKL